MTKRELYRSESLHHSITVDESDDGVVSLRFNGRLQSSIGGPDALDSVQPYFAFLHLPFAIATSARRVLVIGLGGGVLPKRMWHDYPELRIDAVELDPEVIDVSRRFFGLPDDERLHVIAAEGRSFLEKTVERWDIIVIDAYFETSMPFDLTTREFLALCHDRLTPGGVLAYNLVGVLSGRGSHPFHRFVKGMRETFAATYVFPVGVDCGGRRQNIVVLASDTLVDTRELQATIRSRAGGRVKVPGFETFGDRLADRTLPRGVSALTDAEKPADGLLHA
jgi:spermidine synthase